MSEIKKSYYVGKTISDLKKNNETIQSGLTSLETEVDEKVDKTSIIITKDDSATDDQVYSAKAINTELDLKANDSEVVKKNDVTTLYTLTIGDTVELVTKNYQYLDVTQNCTLVLPTVTDYCSIELTLNINGDYSVTFPSDINWQVGTALSKIGNGVQFTVILSYINSSWKGGIVFYA